MNKKFIKTLANITCGLGIIVSIPFMSSSCSCGKKTNQFNIYDNTFKMSSELTAYYETDGGQNHTDISDWKSWLNENKDNLLVDNKPIDVDSFIGEVESSNELKQFKSSTIKTFFKGYVPETEEKEGYLTFQSNSDYSREFSLITVEYPLNRFIVGMLEDVDQPEESSGSLEAWYTSTGKSSLFKISFNDVTDPQTQYSNYLDYQMMFSGNSIHFVVLYNVISHK